MTDAKLAEPPQPAPAMSPSAKPARGLRQKVLDELKSVRRKSDKQQTPANTPLVEPVGGAYAALLPPPLVLNPPAAPTAEEEDSGGRLSSGQLSPGIGAPGKPRGCSICERSFTVFRAKHTCKMCGSRICDDCSKSRVKLHRRLERKKGSRLCDPCARKYAQGGTTPLLSPGASPMVVPQNGNGLLLLRRHSVPSQAFSRPLGAPSSLATAAAAKQADAGLSPVAAAASEDCDGTVPSAAGGSAPAVKKQEPHKSHLRLRHWTSLAVVSTLVLLRILLGNAQLPASVDGDLDTNAAAVSFFAAPRYSLARGIDSLLSLKLLGCYVFALAAFDEFLRAKNPQPVATDSAVRRRRRTRNRVIGRRAPRVTTMAASVSPHEADDEVLEVDTGDKVDDSGYSLEKLIAVLEDTTVKSRAAGDELKLAAFLACCEAICAFVLVFGRATSFAGSTVGGYITSINTNLLNWPADVSPPWIEHSVRALVEREVELKVANVGGKKKPSCARCVQRLLWFVEFVEACLKYTLIESADESCSAGASKAYEETIGSRHPWIIRKGVNSALGSIPSRSTILADLNLGGLSAEDAVGRLKVAQAHLRAIVGEIHQTFKKHDLLDIK